jgi:hypothetical protein
VAHLLQRHHGSAAFHKHTVYRQSATPSECAVTVPSGARRPLTACRQQVAPLVRSHIAAPPLGVRRPLTTAMFVSQVCVAHSVANYQITI